MNRIALSLEGERMAQNPDRLHKLLSKSVEQKRHSPEKLQQLKMTNRLIQYHLTLKDSQHWIRIQASDLSGSGLPTEQPNLDMIEESVITGLEFVSQDKPS